LKEPPEIQKLVQVRVAKLKPQEVSCVEETIKDTENSNSCAMVYYQSPYVISKDNQDHKKKLLMDLVMHQMEESYFNELRNNQHLGYILFSRAHNDRNVIGCSFTLQSNSFCNEFVIHQINEYIESQKEVFNNLTEKEFEQLKSGV
jgi:secreted Zn-dependent insulinase-like peptidase